jgi:hypothetical protein
MCSPLRYQPFIAKHQYKGAQGKINEKASSFRVIEFCISHDAAIMVAKAASNCG